MLYWHAWNGRQAGRSYSIARRVIMDRKYVAQNSVAVCERIDGGVGALRLEVYLQLCSVRVRSWCCHHTSSGREGRTEQGRGEELEEAPSPPRATRDRWMELGLMPEIQFKYLWPFLLLLYLIINPSFVTFLVTPCLLEVRDPEKKPPFFGSWRDFSRIAFASSLARSRWPDGTRKWPARASELKCVPYVDSIVKMVKPRRFSSRLYALRACECDVMMPSCLPGPAKVWVPLGKGKL